MKVNQNHVRNTVSLVNTKVGQVYTNQSVPGVFYMTTSGVLNMETGQVRASSVSEQQGWIHHPEAEVLL